MRNRVERLRVWLVVGAMALILVLAAFIGSARYLRRRYLAGLPARLGINIVRDTDGYTDCQTLQGRKVYCIHAAKAIEHTDGKTILHDVSMTLYGKKGDRSDRIYGDEFEYDEKAQVVRATGVVHIDLQSAEEAGRSGGRASSAKVMHVTTSGLVFLRKLGVAATSDPIEFEAGGMTGHAVGADYSSDSGLMVLHSAVTIKGMAGGHAVAMTARTAQFDEHSGQAVLTLATYEAEGRRASADEATLDRRADGTLSRISALGDVKVEDKGATVTSKRADIALTAESQPQTVVLTGAVSYAADGPLRQMHGAADEATISLDAKKKPQPENAVFLGAVHMTERTQASVGAAWSVRDLTAAKVEASFVRGATGVTRVRDVEATGSPRLSVVDNDAEGGASHTELAADDLKAHLVDTGDARRPTRVDTIVGRGHTLLRQLTADGGERTVAADALDATLRPRSGTTKAGGKAGVWGGSEGERLPEELSSSVQQGHVVMMQRILAKVGAKGIVVGAKVEHATAGRAVYDGDTDEMTLSDGVQVSDAESVVWANQIVFDHSTGDAHAVGGVKVSFVGEASAGNKARVGAETTHVVADRADLLHASGVATFYGRPVRLWQGGSQVQAAVIELSNAEKRLVARGDGAQVLTVLAGRGSPAAGAAGATGRGCESSAGAKKERIGGAQASVTRIVSGGLNYSGTLEQADFTGGVRAETGDGTIRASEGVAYLRQEGGAADANANAPGAAVVGVTGAANEAPSSNAADPVLSGDLDRVVATGDVELDRPGLKATGTRLVYTASDGSALLTGDARTQPKAMEPRGTTTGDALRFRTSCGGGGSVEVLGGSGQRAHTDATVSERRKGEKAK